MLRVELFYCLGLLGRIVFDILRLVHNHIIPINRGKMLFITKRQGIGGDYHVVLFRLLFKCFTRKPLVTMVDHSLERRREPLHFLMPVTYNGHWADEQSWTRF